MGNVVGFLKGFFNRFFPVGIAAQMDSPGPMDLCEKRSGSASEIITDYDTFNEVNLAVIRGELDATAASFSSVCRSIENENLIPIAQYGDAEVAELTGVPNILDLPGIDKDGKQLIDIVLAFLSVERAIVAPRFIADRADFLSDALKKRLENPQFLESAQKRKLEVTYLPPKEVKRIVEKGLNISSDLKEKVIKIMGR